MSELTEADIAALANDCLLAILDAIPPDLTSPALLTVLGMMMTQILDNSPDGWRDKWLATIAAATSEAMQ